MPPIAGIILKSVLGRVVEKVLTRPDVPVANKDAPSVAKKVEQEVKAELAEEKIAVVEVKPARKSKLAWLGILTAAGGALMTIDPTAAFNAIFALIAAFGMDLPEDIRTRIMTGIVSLIGVLTWYFKVYRTKTITPSSAAKE